MNQSIFGKFGTLLALSMGVLPFAIADETPAETPAQPAAEYKCILNVNDASSGEKIAQIWDFPLAIGTDRKKIEIPGREEWLLVDLLKEEVAPGHFESIYEVQVIKGSEANNDERRLAMALSIKRDFLPFEHLSTYSESTNLYYSLSCRNY